MSLPQATSVECWALNVTTPENLSPEEGQERTTQLQSERQALQPASGNLKRKRSEKGKDDDVQSDRCTPTHPKGSGDENDTHACRGSLSPPRFDTPMESRREAFSAHSSSRSPSCLLTGDTGRRPLHERAGGRSSTTISSYRLTNWRDAPKRLNEAEKDAVQRGIQKTYRTLLERQEQEEVNDADSELAEDSESEEDESMSDH